MGYSVFQLSSSFCIPASEATAALQALKRLQGRETCGTKGEMHFMWLGDSSEFVRSTSLQQALGVWRWSADSDDAGAIVDLNFNGENLGDEELLFSTLAPFVVTGSTIVMAGEDGAIWRWMFEGGRVHRQAGRLVFDEHSNTSSKPA